MGCISIPENVLEQNAKDTALPSAVSTALQIKKNRGYYTSNVVKKVLGNPDSNIKTHYEHKQNQILLPATFVHDISKEFEQEGGILNRYSQSPFPHRSDRTLDEFGREAWDTLNKIPETPFSRVEEMDGQQMMRVAVADTMSAQGGYCIIRTLKHLKRAGRWVMYGAFLKFKFLLRIRLQRVEL